MINFAHVDSLDHEPLFKMSLTARPDKSAFDVEADLVEWPLNEPNSVTSDNYKVSFIHREIVDEDTSL